MKLTISQHAVARYLQRAKGFKRDTSTHYALADASVIAAAGPAMERAAREEIRRIVTSQQAPLDCKMPIVVRDRDVQVILVNGHVVTVKLRNHLNRRGTMEHTADSEAV